MKPSRYRYMRRVSNRVAPEVKTMEKIYEREIACPDGELQDLVFSTINRQKKAITVRSSYVFLCHDYLNAFAAKKAFPFTEIPQKILDKIAFLADASMVMMYRYNHIYDGKFGVNNITAYKYTLGGTNIFKDLIFDYINTLDLDANLKLFILDKLKRSYKHVDLGQLIDKKYGFSSFLSNKENCEAMTSLKEEDALPEPVLNLIESLKKEYPGWDNVFDVYFARIYLINSSLLKSLTEILFKLTEFPEDQKDAQAQILLFPKLMGLYMQVVNDCTDFILDSGNSNKAANDVLSDLRNETISAPIMLHYFSGKPTTTNLIRGYIKRKYYSQKFTLEGKHNEVLRETIESGGLEKAMEIGKKIAMVAKESLTKGITLSEKEEKNSSFTKLAELTSLAFWNRYYYHIKKAKAAYKKGVLYRCEDHLSSVAKQKKGNKKPTNGIKVTKDRTKQEQVYT